MLSLSPEPKRGRVKVPRDYAGARVSGRWVGEGRIGVPMSGLSGVTTCEEGEGVDSK